MSVDPHRDAYAARHPTILAADLKEGDEYRWFGETRIVLEVKERVEGRVRVAVGRPLRSGAIFTGYHEFQPDDRVVKP